MVLVVRSRREEAEGPCGPWWKSAYYSKYDGKPVRGFKQGSEAVRKNDMENGRRQRAKPV